MTDAIADFCRHTGQPIPQNKGAIIRYCLESLAMQYRLVARQLEEIYDTQIETLHIVGGGTQNTLLNQLAADATGLTVLTGPVEATVIGNIAMQAIGAGHIGSLAEARTIIRNSFEMKTYTPQDTAEWDEQFDRFMKLKKA
jgi:rhamnulokinase